MLALKKNLSILSILTLIFLCVPTFVFAAGTIENILWTLVNGVFGMFMGLAGLLLNVGIEQFVVGFGDQFLTKGAGVVVDALWVNVRDIFNITFIFGLVYIGFKMILNSDDSNTRRWLVNLILAALLVNFSLFITKLIVDFTNILATQIVTGGFGGTDISGKFMSSLGLTSIWGGTETLPGNGAYGYIFGAAMLFIVGTFVFAAGGIMLIIRYAALCLYMVMSPLMFLGWVFPGLQSVTSNYWKGFLGRAFFAPVYVLLLFFALSILQQFYGAGGGQSPQFKDLFSAGGGTVNSTFQTTLPPFILACIFLIAAVVVANKLSADGASTAIKIGNNLKGRAQRRLQQGAVGSMRLAASPATGAAKWGARRGSYALGNTLDRSINRMQKSNSKAARWVGNSVVADDFARGNAAKLKSNKFGLKNTIDEENKKKANIDNRYANYQKLKAGQEAQQTNAKYNPKTHAILPGTGEVVERDKVTNQATLNEITDAEKAREQQIAEAQGVINNLSQKELEDMFSSDRTMFDNVVGQIKAGQFDKLTDSDNFTSKQKDELKASRQEAIRNTFEKTGATLTENLQNLSLKQIETLGDDFIRQNAALLSQSQMDSIIKSDTYTEGQKGAYIGARKQGQVTMARKQDQQSQLFSHNTSDNPSAYTKKKKAVEIANLPFEVFIDKSGVNTDTIKQIDGSVLEEIFAKKTMSAEQRNQLRDAVLADGNPDAKGYLNSVLGRRNWNTTDPVATSNTPTISLDTNIGAANRDMGRE